MQPARSYSLVGSVDTDDTTCPKDIEPKKSVYTRRQWIIFFTFCFINIGASMCYSVQAPFYPKEAEKKGVSPSVYGLVFGVFELVDFILCPIYGKNIRRLGPNFMLVAGNFVMSTCCILFGFLDRVTARDQFVALSFIIRIVEAAGQAGFVTASYAIIAQEFPNNVATTFSALETTFGVGMIVGPTVGGVLYELGGFLLPFAVVGGVLFAASIFSAFFLPEIRPPPDKTGSLLKLVLLPGIAICYYAVVAVSFSFGFTTAILEPHLRSFGLSPSVMGLFFVLGGGTYALTATLWGYLADKYVNPKILCGLGAIFIVVAFLLLGPAPFFPLEPTVWMTIVALVLHGLGTGGEYVSAFLDSSREAMANGYPDNLETYGLISGLWASGLALGSFIGPSASGVLSDAVGFRSATLVVVALHVLVVIVSFGYYFWQKSRGRVAEAAEANERTPLTGS